MRKTLRVLLGVVAVIVAIIGGGWLMLPDMCGNQIVAQYPSPDGAKKLVVFQRDCGATTGFSTQASMLEASDSLENDGGNVFVSDANHGAAPTGPGGGPAVNVRWESTSVLRISYHPATRVFKSEAEFEGVTIHYATELNSAQQTAATDSRVNALPVEQ